MEASADGLTHSRPTPGTASVRDVLPRLSYAEVDAANALAQYRSEWTFKGQFGAMRARLCHRIAINARDVPFAGMKLDIDGEAMTVWVPARSLAAIAFLSEPGVSMAEVPAIGRGLLFEYVLDDLLAHLESRGHCITVLEVTNPQRNPDGRLGLICSVGDLPRFPALIDCSAGMAQAIVHMAADLPPGSMAFAELPILVRMLAGVTRLSNAEFIGLRDGDTIIFDHTWLKDRRVPITVGDAVIFTGMTRSGGFRLESNVQVSDMRERMTWLTDDFIGEGALMSEGETSTLDTLEVKLVFEVGRLAMTLGELNRLDAGHVFELNRQPEQSVDVYVLNKQVGSGELVMVGERIGVRLTKVFR